MTVVFILNGEKIGFVQDCTVFPRTGELVFVKNSSFVVEQITFDYDQKVVWVLIEKEGVTNE